MRVELVCLHVCIYVYVYVIDGVCTTKLVTFLGRILVTVLRQSLEKYTHAFVTLKRGSIRVHNKGGHFFGTDL